MCPGAALNRVGYPVFIPVRRLEKPVCLRAPRKRFGCGIEVQLLATDPVRDVPHVYEQRALVGLFDIRIRLFPGPHALDEVGLMPFVGKKPFSCATIFLALKDLPSHAVPAEIHHVLRPVDLDPLAVLRPERPLVPMRSSRFDFPMYGVNVVFSQVITMPGIRT